MSKTFAASTSEFTLQSEAEESSKASQKAISPIRVKVALLCATAFFAQARKYCKTAVVNQLMGENVVGYAEVTSCLNVIQKATLKWRKHISNLSKSSGKTPCESGEMSTTNTTTCLCHWCQ